MDRAVFLLISTLFLLPYSELNGIEVEEDHVNLLEKIFSKEELDLTHTAKDEKYLSENEKQVIHYLNLARVYPAKFAEYYRIYLQKYDTYGFSLYREKNKYYHSLYLELMARRYNPGDLLVSDYEMYELAKCWAIESGRKGITGHNRKQCERGYFAECCAYKFSEDPMKFVLMLLIDYRVKSLGHRKTMLSEYSKVGVSIESHKTYNKCLVMDFM